MTKDELNERLGQLIDKAENLLGATKLPLPDSIHVQGLRGGMEGIRDELKAVYFENGGDDVWD